MAGILDAPHIQRIIPPFVTLLIFFLTFFPQYLFTLTDDSESPFYLSPGPLTPFQLKYMNTWALYILYTYYKTVRTDSGRYLFTPQTLRAAAKRQGIANPPEVPTDPAQRTPTHFAHLKFPPGTRWCRKCSTPKPPRAHHCKLCARCIPRMDHHCPWTANCVSLTTAPHFLRFVLSTTIGLWVLFRLVLQRATWVFSLRDQPAYLGPDIHLLAALLFLLLVNLVTALALSLIAFQSARSALLNETMIEGWQKDRHASLLAKGPTWFPTPDGDSVRLQHVEFPYDIDFLTNICESMSSYNPTLWIFPLTWTPRLSPIAAGLGWEYPENGFNRLPGMWPPPDPQKQPPGSQNGRWPAADLGKAEQDSALLRKSTVEEQKRAFRERQAMDRTRWAAFRSSKPGYILREVNSDTDMLAAYARGESEENEEEDEYVGGIRKVVGGDENYELFDGPAPVWRNAEGETLEDYGVEKDEGSDDDVPIGELIRRKKLGRKEE